MKKRLAVILAAVMASVLAMGFLGGCSKFICGRKSDQYCLPE